MSTLAIILFWVVIFVITILHWLIKILTGRREEAIDEIVFLLIGLVTLWFVGAAIAVVSGQIDLIFQTWLSEVRFSEAQKQFIQAAALLLAALLILNIEKVLAKIHRLFLQILTWMRKN